MFTVVVSGRGSGPGWPLDDTVSTDLRNCALVLMTLLTIIRSSGL